MALLLAVALLAVSLPGPGRTAPGKDQIVAAREALARGDGIAAEVSLRRALEAGAQRDAVAAYMGEAMLLREAPERARDWLAPGLFSPTSAAHGFRQLARLERSEGDLAAAGKAFDRAMAITPRDPAMWVEIGRLRYAGGEHMLAIDAAGYALKLDPENVRALEFKGQLVRDSQGLDAALPWFEQALQSSPRDIAVLGEYAATLGDLGRAKKMLAVTRLMLSIQPGNARAYFLQAVLAARAGKTDLARRLLARTGGKYLETPVGQLLEGVLELRAGNPVLAADVLAKLHRAQPGNARVALLLARAQALGGENRLLIHDFAEAASRPEASPYLLALLGRAYEREGRRELAAPLLDRAGQARRPSISPATSSEIGALLMATDVAAARVAAGRAVAKNAGSAFNQAIAGDVLLATGDPVGALEHYRLAAHVRLSRGLLLRMVSAAAQSGREGEAEQLVEGYLANSPSDPVAVRLAAVRAARRGDWQRARLLLEHLAAGDGTRDAALLADLSLAQQRSGEPKRAEATARRAYAIQRGSPLAAEAWGRSLQALGHREKGKALLAKSRTMFAAP